MNKFQGELVKTHTLTITVVVTISEDSIDTQDTPLQRMQASQGGLAELMDDMGLTLLQFKVSQTQCPEGCEDGALTCYHEED